jgi:hypothetical protein
MVSWFLDGGSSGRISIPGDIGVTATETAMRGLTPPEDCSERCHQTTVANAVKCSSCRRAEPTPPCDASLALRHAECLELRPSLLEIIVNDDLIVHARSLRVRNLILSLLQTRQNRFLAVRCATPQPLLQDLDRRRLQEQEARVEIRLLDLLDTL